MASETSDRAELEALVDRLTRRAEEITHMDVKIAMSLETEEDIQQELKQNQPYRFKIIYQTSNSRSHDFLSVNKDHQ